MVLMETFSEILQRPTIGAVLMEVMIFLSPVWIAFLVGVLVGWVWKPRWANSRNNGKFDCSSPTSIISSPVKGFGSMQSLNSSKVPKPSCMDSGVDKQQILFPSSTENTNCSSSSSHLKNEEPVTVVEDDLDYLYHLVERTDGGPPWKHMMDRSVPNMNYQAWQRDPETGPPQYCTRTIYEDATPELLRDFFWDDVSRLKWDDMLVHSETMEECPTTGTMVVHWIRKFPFLCSDREYIIGRRIWESGRSYYCITKGVPRPSVPRRDKPRRVDLFYSSWFIQAVESRKEHGQLTACEVILFHHEDMGIPREIAKFGIRQGMWGTVKKIERGLRDYQKARASGGQISRHAFMAQISTKINPDYMKSLENAEESSETQVQVQVLDLSEKPTGMNIPKLLLFGGAVVLVCSIDRGLLTKTLIFGIARRFANAGRRL